VISGPLVSDDGEKMIGSLFLVEAPGRDEVEAFNRADPFTEAGIGNAFRLRDLYGAKAESVAALVPILLATVERCRGRTGFRLSGVRFLGIRADPRAVQAATHLAVRQ